MELSYVIQGTTYPTALGNNTNTILGAIESECLRLHIDYIIFLLPSDSASMLIMIFAHLLKTGDSTLANKYVGIFVF